MGFWQRLSNRLRRPSATVEHPPHPPAAQPEPITVPEVTAADLQAADRPLLLLDCREMMEWKQVRLATAVHIPMNQIPSRLAEIDQEAEVVVYCATGARSRSVAEYLLRQGYQATNLQGGIFAWERAGFPTESDYRYDD